MNDDYDKGEVEDYKYDSYNEDTTVIFTFCSFDPGLYIVMVLIDYVFQV